MKKNLYWMAAAFITLTAVGCTNAKKANVSCLLYTSDAADD